MTVRILPVLLLLSCALSQAPSKLSVAISSGTGNVRAYAQMKDAAVPGVTFIFTSEQKTVECVTDQNGACAGRFAPGRWQVRMEMAGIVPVSTAVEITPVTDVLLTAEIRFPRGAAEGSTAPQQAAGLGEFRIRGSDVTKLPVP